MSTGRRFISCVYFLHLSFFFFLKRRGFKRLISGTICEVLREGKEVLHWGTNLEGVLVRMDILRRDV